VVAETLASMVTVVPALDAEKFLIHDVWGHGWEESLCDFEWSYAQLADLRAPIAAADVREAFVVSGARVLLDREIWRMLVAGDLRRRLTLALNTVLAECLADLVEHKYARLHGVPALPSSSLLPLAPLKIDLSLQDTRALLKAAHRSYRRLEKPEESARLIADLVATGLPGEGLNEAVDEAVAMVRQIFGSALDTRMVIGAARNGAFAVDLAQRVMLGIVALDAALERYLAAAPPPAEGGARWHQPRASIDLLVLLLAWFYEQDRSVNFWHLDELLRHELDDTTRRFETELRAVLSLG
jgi:hypothetical protein